ncbi:MAG: glycyl-radical enzyme activating protein [Chloroflexi bacterium]|nr:glycyl-radical enzyme activating protein [Chloroflexota bacterium]
MSVITGRILHLQRLSTEDGPGIRTTVFFKGCPLRCGWCHNPESISSVPQIQWLEMHCIACDTCMQTCPKGCLSRAADGTLVIDREICDGCGECAEACPANAIELLGKTVTVEELVAEVVKDRSFYAASGGGVTVSGGEPGLQPDFVAELLRQVRAAGIPTALDTCGLVSRPGLERILPHVDLVLFDLKEINPQKHRDFTTQGNERILATLLFLHGYMQTAPHLHLWVRTPLIPGATATSGNLAGIGDFLSRNLDGQLERWELCAFNNLCRDKYRRLGLTWEYQDTPLLTADELHELAESARDSGIRPELVFATGVTRAAM